MKYLLTLTAYFFIHFSTLVAQNVTVLQEEAEKLETANQGEALKKYQEILKLDPVNTNALCKSSEMCSLIGHRQVKKEDKISYFTAARKFAEVALKTNGHNSEANFAMAVSMGRMALISSGKEKIEAVNDIKKYAELAVKNDPKNFKAYHVLGKWHYEVSSLGTIERAAVRFFYGGIPAATLKESIVYYEKSKLLNPYFALNYLELAKAYHRNDQDDKAISELTQLQKIPNSQQDDPTVKEEGKKLLEACKH